MPPSGTEESQRQRREHDGNGDPVCREDSTEDRSEQGEAGDAELERPAERSNGSLPLADAVSAASFRFGPSRDDERRRCCTTARAMNDRDCAIVSARQAA